MNGLQNFSGYLEYFALGNSSTNSSCTETSNLREDARLVLVRPPASYSSYCTTTILAHTNILHREPLSQLLTLEEP